MNNKKKCRQYDEDYIQYGFVANANNPLLPHCILCGKDLANSSMKPSKLLQHQKTQHPNLINKPKQYFLDIKNQSQSCSNALKGFIVNQNNPAGLTASYNIALLIAKQGRPHTIAEDLIKPSIYEALKVANVTNPTTVLQSIPLSNNTISSRIAEMAEDVKSMLIKHLQSCRFSLTFDESVFGSQAVILAFVRYIKEAAIREELLLMETLTFANGESVSSLISNFLKENDIDLSNMISICTDGAPSMIGKTKGAVARLCQGKNVFTIHCVLHRENLIAKKSGQIDFNETLKTVVNAINKIKSRALQDRLFQEACQDEDFQRLIYYTEVRWLSMGNCLTRFVALFDIVVNFLKENNTDLSESLLQQKNSILYLENIFRALNELNLSLQKSDINLVRAQQLIKSFINKIMVWKLNVAAGNYFHFPNMNAQIIDEILQKTIEHHLEFLYENFELRFNDLLELTIPKFVDQIHNMTVNDVANEKQELQMELCDIMADVRMKESAKVNWVDAGLENCEKYKATFNIVEPFIINLPTSYLAEKGFSIVLHSFTKQRSKMRLQSNPEIRLRLTKLTPRISELITRKQAQGSH